MEKTPNRWHEQRLAKGEKVRGGYIVFRRGETTGRIKVSPHKLPFEHGSADSASSEARRLSQKNPGIEFSVFRETISFTAEPNTHIGIRIPADDEQEKVLALSELIGAVVADALEQSLSRDGATITHFDEDEINNFRVVAVAVLDDIRARRRQGGTA